MSKAAKLFMFALACGGLCVSGVAIADGGIKFVAGRYYYDLSYGKVSLAQGQSAPTYEFYRESRLPGSTIWKVHFRSILRVEFPSESAAIDSSSKDAEKATIAWNRSRTHILASFSEHAFILSPDFNIQAAYRNTENARWLNDAEIEATVETGVPSVYATGLFAINVSTDHFRRIK